MVPFALLALCVSTVAGARISSDGGATMRPRVADPDAPAQELQPAGNRGDGPVDFADPDDSKVQAHWAVLVAGSQGWGNYRHQADALHAYHVLHKGGYHPDHMVVLMADDLADAPENPFPGKVFNRPGGPNVYKDVPIDYRGQDVTSDTFLAVLTGDEHAVRHKGSGRVVASGPRDRVFLFYSDHGAAGVLGMPNGPFLYADQVMAALQKKASHHGFKEMVLYIEACESGSMFEGMLEDNMNVYVTTAANAFESSWATYCPTFGGGGDPPAITTCMGDLYSVAWMEEAEKGDMTSESLERQYRLVKARTSNNFTYMQGSHVMQYGDLTIDKEWAASYEGTWNNGSARPTPAARARSALAWLLRRIAQLRRSLAHWHWRLLQVGGGGSSSQPVVGSAASRVAQRDADLVPLMAQARSNSAAGTAAASALQQALAKRRRVDAAAQAAVEQLLRQPAQAAALQALSSSAGAGPASRRQLRGRGLAAAIVGGAQGRPAPGVPLVDSWDCLRAMVAAWEGECGALDQYGMRHTRLFANLCNAGLQASHLAGALSSAAACA